jgi:hypothetical protein
MRGRQKAEAAKQRQTIAALKECFARHQTVKFAYLFGSTARGAAGPLSDLDLAVYLDGRLDFFKSRLRLREALAKVLQTERFDLVVLNKAPLVLKHEVVKNGIVLKEDRSRRVMFETEVLQEYLDTAYLRSVHYRYVREQIEEGRYFG